MSNWNVVLSSTRNLNDVLIVLQKVLALLQNKADVTTIDEALDSLATLDQQAADSIREMTNRLNQFGDDADAATNEAIMRATVRGFATETTLKAWKPNFDGARAKADDTKKVWRWELTSAAGVTPITGNWVDTGLSELDQARSYTDFKLDTIYINVGINLFDKDNITAGYRPTHTIDGLTVAVGQNTSDFIKVQQNYQYVRNTSGPIWVSFYKSDKTFLSGIYLPSNLNINTPTDAAYMRVSVADAQLNTAMFTRSELYTSDYVAYNSKMIATSTLDFDYIGNDFDKVKTHNLLNFKQLEFISYSVVDGTQSGNSLAPWILLQAKPAYFYSSNFINSAFIFYDESMQFISTINSTHSAKAPKAAAFVRVRVGVNQTIAMIKAAVVAESSHIADDFIANEVQRIGNAARYGLYQSKWYNKTWFVMGDSISTGNGLAATYASKPYHYLIAKDKKIKVHNIAVSGRTIAIASSANNLNQQVTNGSMPDAANAPDLITIFAGTNDFGYNVPMGTISDTDPATFFGGLNKLFTDLQTRFPLASVGVITPIQRSDRADLNALGLALGNYVDAIKITARKYAIPVLDLYTNGCGINFNSDAMTQIYTVSNDKIHPNDVGHRILAPKIAAFIESL